MKKISEGIRYDANFVRSHTLQPRWYKVLKVVILLGFLAGYAALLGWKKTIAFLVVFLLLNLGVHMLYRMKTHQFTQTWLDFIVVGDGAERKYKPIGMFYYAAIIVNTIIAIAISVYFMR